MIRILHNCRKDDREWIKGQFSRLPSRYHDKAINGYIAAFDEAYSTEDMEHKKRNAARKAANNRLRKFVENVNARV